MNLKRENIKKCLTFGDVTHACEVHASIIEFSTHTRSKQREDEEEERYRERERERERGRERATWYWMCLDRSIRYIVGSGMCC